MKTMFTIIFTLFVLVGFSQVKISKNVQKMFSSIQDSNAPKAFKASAAKAINAFLCEVYDPWTGECVIPGKESKVKPAQMLKGRKDALIAFDRMLTKLQSQSEATRSLNRKAPKVSRESKHFLLDMAKRLDFFASTKNFGVPVAAGHGPK